eukprot:TRINITY_DN1931_c0_g1_i1.p1 TRINITY_DN1931_c0_g1~~TRINITY_DN1931_c0_g1_i1.p1  ORF type:complete len:222 (-),score=52.64 TRINITY_DN1931_c0_g1_i1:194-799(-)
MSSIENLLHTFRHSWSNVSLAYWLKYPHPSRPDVQGFDVVKREFDPETYTLKTTRVGLIRSSWPTWINSFLGDSMIFIEEAVIQPKQNRMELNGRNLTCSNIIELRERCLYCASSENPAWTTFQQEATVSAPGFSTSYVEGVIRSIFSKNSQKGKELMENVLSSLPQPTNNISNNSVNGKTTKHLSEAVIPTENMIKSFKG